MENNFLPILYMSAWFLGYFGVGYLLRNFTDLSTTIGLSVGLIILVGYDNHLKKQNNY